MTTIKLASTNGASAVNNWISSGQVAADVRTSHISNKRSIFGKSFLRKLLLYASGLFKDDSEVEVKVLFRSKRVN